jgi:hypothetical protein
VEYSFMKKYWIFLGVFIVINSLQAQIFKWTDSSGDVHFSDKPHPGAEEIELPQVQTYSTSTAPVGDKVPDPIADPSEGAYEKISILQPEDQATIRNTEGYVSIIAELQPPLRKGDKIQVIFDGAPLGKPQPTSVIALRGINRGSHTFAVQVLDSSKKVLNTSEPVTIFMMPPRTNMIKGAR